MNIICKKLYIIVILIILTQKVFSQEHFIIKGIIFNQTNTVRIENAVIYNMQSNEEAFSDEWGTFSIKIKLGDSLKIFKNNFQENIVIVNKKQNLVVNLKPTYQLNEVIVSSQSTKQMQQEILEGYRAKGVYNNGNIPFLMYIFNPLTALQNLIGADAKNARNFNNYIKRENKEQFIDAKFNKDVIIKNVPVKENELVEFMYKYRPKYEDVIYWNEYDAINYIKKSYTQYKNLNR